MRAVFDTNVLGDLLEGVPQARQEFNRYANPSTSIVSWVELLVGTRAAGREDAARQLLARFDIRPVTEEVAELAIAIRDHRGIKLPDAIIWATARATNWPLVTRDRSDFPKDDPGIRFPYSR